MTRRVTQAEYDQLREERKEQLDDMPGGAQGAGPDMSDVEVDEENPWIESPPTHKHKRPDAVGHPPGFHKSEEAKRRCWGCSAPEKLEPSEVDMAKARQLIAEGWLSTSNKYRSVARVHVPPFAQAVTFDPAVPRWLREYVERAYESWSRHGMRCEREKVEHLELTVTEFRAFKMLGGQSA